MAKCFRPLFVLLVLLISVSTGFAQNAILQGAVKDAGDGTSLIGATVSLLKATNNDVVSGAATDVNGRYRISVPAGSYNLSVTYVGYQTIRQTVTLTAGQTVTLDFSLADAGNTLNEVVVSASRQSEKILDAPASVSVLDAREVQNQATPSVAAVLRNVEGVDMAQTGVDRYEVVLRGFNNAFSGAAYTLIDYRQGAIASLNANAHSMMPISNIDLERVEIVRGPGSALYGPGVDAGVVHFITKNPFDHKGTTVALGGGQQSTMAAAWRHAGVSSSNKLGYKIAGQYSQAKDFTMDVMAPQDFIQLDTTGDKVVVLPDGTGLKAYALNEDQSAVTDVTGTYTQTALQALRDVPRDYDTYKLNLNGMVEYKLGGKSALIVNGGHSVSSGTYMSGIGNLQAIDFGYTYGQVRFQSGSFFAAASLNRNNHGQSYIINRRRLDGNGNVITGQEGTVYDHSQKWNAQVQNDSRPSEKLRIIYGADMQYTIPDTDGTIYGRNEENDAIMETGAYAQAQYALSPKLDLTLAARGDYNDIIGAFSVSPRLAVVFKPNNTSSIRATFNQAFSSPGNNSLFLDIPAGQTSFGAFGTAVVRGRGAYEGFTFERNAAYPGGVVASSLLPWSRGADTAGRLNYGELYGNLIYPGLNATPNANLAALINQALGAQKVNEATVATLKQLLAPAATKVNGGVDALMVMVNVQTGQALPVNGVVDVDPLKQTKTQTIELGYKGIFGGKLLLAVDAYYSKKKDFVGPLLMQTPLFLAQNFTTDLTTQLAAAIEANPQLKGALTQLGIPSAQVAGLIVGFANQNNALARIPVAIAQPEENNPGVGKMPELMLSYRNFGDVSYWGLDTSLRFIASDQLSLFANMSYTSDNFFDESEVNEPGSGLYLAMNAPQMKVKLGGDYRLKNGFSANLSFRYNQGFAIASGPYLGGLPKPYNNESSKIDDIGVEDYYLVDLGAGYAFSKRLRLDALVQNVTDNQVRQFYGAPVVGRYSTQIGRAHV